MRDPIDHFTLELIEAAAKRGRGRPRLANALTPAQRAKRYRDKLKVKPASADYGFKKVCLKGNAPTWAYGFYIRNCPTTPYVDVVGAKFDYGFGF